MILKSILLFTIILLLLTSACTLITHSPDAPSRAVERYLQAKVAGDAQTVRLLLCAEMEEHWEREAHSFDAVGGANIEGLSCQRRNEGNIVECQGQIVANYGGEERVFPLSAYRVVFEGGEWRWCGEAP